MQSKSQSQANMSQPLYDFVSRIKQENELRNENIEAIVKEMMEKQKEKDEKYRKLMAIFKDFESESDENDQNTTNTSKSDRAESPHSSQKMEKTESQKFICDICKKEYVMQFLLKSHMRIHGTRIEYECMICNKRFTSVQHRRIHQLFCADKRKAAEKTSQKVQFDNRCHKCGKKFQKPESLSKHMNGHFDEEAKQFRRPRGYFR